MTCYSICSFLFEIHLYFVFCILYFVLRIYTRYYIQDTEYTYAVAAFLPAFLINTSPAYLIPLPRYGSGNLFDFISAATCPTNSLSTPIIFIVFFSTLNKIPDGAFICIGCEYPRFNSRSSPLTIAL